MIFRAQSDFVYGDGQAIFGRTRSGCYFRLRFILWCTAQVRTHVVITIFHRFHSFKKARRNIFGMVLSKAPYSEVRSLVLFDAVIFSVSCTAVIFTESSFASRRFILIGMGACPCGAYFEPVIFMGNHQGARNHIRNTMNHIGQHDLADHFPV